MSPIIFLLVFIKYYNIQKELSMASGTYCSLVSFFYHQGRIDSRFKRIHFRFQRIDSQYQRIDSPVYAAWRAGTSNRVVIPAHQAGHRFLSSLKGLQIRALNNRHCWPFAAPENSFCILYRSIFCFSSDKRKFRIKIYIIVIMSRQNDKKFQHQGGTSQTKSIDGNFSSLVAKVE
jgi:hypothetical protein